MATSSSLVLLVLTILVFTISSKPISSSSKASSKQKLSASRKFIKSSCNTTTYPSLCYKTLKPYAPSVGTDPWKLCDAALSATLIAATNSSATISGVANKGGLSSQETAVVQDCQDNVDDSIDEINQSIQAVKNVRKSTDKELLMADIKTWLSAAITDYSTCTDGFSDFPVRAGVKSKIKKTVSRASKVTSFTLSLVNHLDV